MEFFRHCPGCGRRFHIKLLDKKLIELDRIQVADRTVTNPYGGGVAYSAAPAVFIVHDGRSVVIDVEEFQYAYKCKHCGHEWSEKRIEEHREA